MRNPHNTTYACILGVGAGWISKNCTVEGDPNDPATPTAKMKAYDQFLDSLIKNADVTILNPPSTKERLQGDIGQNHVPHFL